MHTKTAWFLYIVLIAISGSSLAQTTATLKNHSTIDSQDGKSVNKFNEIIHKTYLAAEELLSDDTDDLKIPVKIPIKGIYIQTAEGDEDPEELILEAPDLSEPDEPGVPMIDLDIPPDDSKDKNTVGGVKSFFQNRQKEKDATKPAQSSTLYWKNLRKERLKKKREEKIKRNEEQESKTLEQTKGRLKKGESPFPNRKPENTYRTQRLPSSINKKSYSKENSHLPKVIYQGEYKKILFHSAATGNLDVLRAMIKRFETTETRDNEGNTPILYAVMAGNKNSVTVLAGMNASIDTRNYAGVSPLHAAISSSRPDLIDILLSRKINTDIPDKNGKTPLMLAIEMNDLQTAETLLNKNAKINKKMKNGNTALHIATKIRDQSFAYLLISKGADIEIRNFTGNTPLMTAAEIGNEDAINLLLTTGADTSKKDALGREASRLASKKGFTSVAELIESEDIRRQLLTDRIIKARSRNKYIPQKANNTKPTPFPAKKPVKINKKAVPIPSFTKEQKANMRKAN